jgi:hypothetical protein
MHERCAKVDFLPSGSLFFPPPPTCYLFLVLWGRRSQLQFTTLELINYDERNHLGAARR